MDFRPETRFINVKHKNEQQLRRVVVNFSQETLGSNLIKYKLQINHLTI